MSTIEELETTARALTDEQRAALVKVLLSSLVVSAEQRSEADETAEAKPRGREAESGQDEALSDEDFECRIVTSGKR